MRVSVVVPVFNTGSAVEALIDSLRAQTLPVEEWEAIFVDDGSSDSTPEIIERLIATRPNMRLLREAPSGWPGRPRNVGLDAARGDYVFFSDDDDTLGTESLERLSAFAAEHHSDVVIPRTVGRNRGVPAMTRTVVDAQDKPALMMSSLAPQKLFRREFLVENRIRFTEGHFRLEDHLFVVTAYLRAQRVSTYADYPVYYLTYRAGRPHISQQHPDWVAYFQSVRACLDRVDAEAKDDRIRRAMRSRWLRVEALSRLRGDSWRQLASPALLHEVRSLIVERYDLADLTALKPIDRMLAALIVDQRERDAEAFARWESAAEVTSRVIGAEIRDDGAPQIDVRSSLSSTPLPTGGVPGDERYPSEAELLEQLASFTRVGLELEHHGTRIRRPMRVSRPGEGLTHGTLSLAEPLLPGRWSVLVLAGEHRTRRRRALLVEHGALIGSIPARIGGHLLVLVDARGLRLRVRPAASARLLPRIRRRIRGVLRAHRA